VIDFAAERYAARGFDPERQTMFDVHAYMFWLIASLTGLCAIATVITQNIVRSATWLLFALAGTSGVFFLLGADFVGATQLLVYVGGTLVLVVFGVMLTAQGPFISMQTGAAEWVVAAAVGLLLYGVLAFSFFIRPDAFPIDEAKNMNDPAKSLTSVELGESLLGIDQATPKSSVSGLSFRPRKQVSYLLPFEIVSVHLLVVLVGAAYLARAKRRRRAVA
jgi:NADH-quinone oxidoreductase subunit J